MESSESKDSLTEFIVFLRILQVWDIQNAFSFCITARCARCKIEKWTKYMRVGGKDRTRTIEKIRKKKKRGNTKV